LNIATGKTDGAHSLFCLSRGQTWSTWSRAGRLGAARRCEDVRGLLTQLRARGGVWDQASAEDKVQILVNKQFSTPETKISDGDVIAIVSSSPG
jgi:molybdopterin converting factor small subunit